MKNETRDALVRAREIVLHDHDDDRKGRATELVRLDSEIKAQCPHDSINWNSRSADDGGIITTCEICEVSWYEHVR